MKEQRSQRALFLYASFSAHTQPSKVTTFFWNMQDHHLFPLSLFPSATYSLYKFPITFLYKSPNSQLYNSLIINRIPISLYKLSTFLATCTKKSASFVKILHLTITSFRLACSFSLPKKEQPLPVNCLIVCHIDQALFQFRRWFQLVIYNVNPLAELK